MNKTQKIIFGIIGFINLTIMGLSIPAIGILLGILLHSWIPVVVATILLFLDIWRHIYYTKQGKIATLGTYADKDSEKLS